MDMSGREPHDNDRIGNSTSSGLSNESSTYCEITSPQKPVLSDSLLSNETSSSGYADFFGIIDGNQVWPGTQFVNKRGEINKGFTRDPGSSNDMGPPKESLTETMLPGPESNLGTPDISSSGSYIVIDSPRETGEAGIIDGNQVWPGTQFVNKRGEINKGFTRDPGSSKDMGPPKESLTETMLPGPESNLGTPDISSSGSYIVIDSPRETDEAGIIDGNQVWPGTQFVNKRGEINNGFTRDPGSSNDMGHPKESLTERKQRPRKDRGDIIIFPPMIRARTDYTNLYSLHPHDHEIDQTAVKKPHDEDNNDPNGYTNLFRPHPHHHEIDQTDVKKPHDEDNTDPKDWPYPFGQLPGDSKRLDSNINWRRIKSVMLVVVICLSVSALVAIIVVNKNVDDPPPPPPPPPPPGKCNNQESVVSPGDRICIPYNLHSTSRISHITMQQTSSTYFYTFFQFNMSVSSTVSHFIRYVDDWIVDYNISRIDQMLRILQPNSYCSNTGKYIVILEYTDGSNPSFEFEVRMKDPQLHQSITSDDQGIHVHCELTGTCLPSSLAIYVNVNNSTLLVPDTNACSYNDKKTGTRVSIQATIPFSMITKNQSISCVPLMRNKELAENLTNTIPTCDEPECKPNCKDASTNTSTYYPHSVYCDKYYQCDNGEAKKRDCPDGTYWEPTKCRHEHFNTTICDINTGKRFTPLRTLNPCVWLK